MKEVMLNKEQAAAAPLTDSVEPSRIPEGKMRVGYSALLMQPMKLFPYLFGFLFLLLWQYEAIHTWFSLERYQLPIPSDILIAMRENGDTLLIYSLYTGVEIIGGFLIGSLLGWLAAVAASYRPQAGAGAISIMASLNAVPIVALAPIMNNWLGDGIASRMGIVSVMTMATMAVSAYKGLRSMKTSYLELMTSYAASPRQLFLKLSFPNALPAIFSALKINMSTSIIGAIVGEFFIASRGLGYLLSDQIRLANMPVAWACIVIAAILGIVLYTIIQFLEKRFIPWSIAHR